jgi:hypothetical protein
MRHKDNGKPFNIMAYLLKVNTVSFPLIENMLWWIIEVEV